MLRRVRDIGPEVGDVALAWEGMELDLSPSAAAG